MTLETLGWPIVCRILPHLDCHSLRNLLAVSEFLRNHALLILPPPDGTRHLIQPLFSSLTGIRSTTEKALSLSPPQEPTIKLYEVYDDNKGNIDDLVSRTLPKLDQLSFVHVRLSSFLSDSVLALIRPRIFIDFHAQTTDSHLDARETKELSQQMTSVSKGVFSGSQTVYDMKGVKSLRLCVTGDFQNMKFPKLQNLFINFSEDSEGLGRPPRFAYITARSLKVLRVHYFGRLPLMTNLSFQSRRENISLNSGLADISLKEMLIDDPDPHDPYGITGRLSTQRQEDHEKTRYLEIVNLNGQVTSKHDFFEDTLTTMDLYMKEMDLSFAGTFNCVTLSGAPMWLLDYMKLRSKNSDETVITVINTVRYAESSRVVSIVQPHRDRVSFNLLNTVPDLTLPLFTRDRLDPNYEEIDHWLNIHRVKMWNIPQVFFKEIVMLSTNTFSFGKLFDSYPSPTMSLEKLVIKAILPVGATNHPVIPIEGVNEIFNSNWLHTLRISGCYLGPNNRAFNVTFPMKDRRYSSRGNIPELDMDLAILPGKGDHKSEMLFLTTFSMLWFRPKVKLHITQLTREKKKKLLLVNLSGVYNGVRPINNVSGDFEKIYVA